MKSIPLCDLKKQYLNLRQEILETIDNLCLESSFIKGPYVKEFEEAFIKANHASYGVGCSNGTSALSLALEALGIGKGDEVLLPSHTFMATAESVFHVGATPVFCDIKSSDYTIDPADIEKKITKKTKAIIPVHIYGTPCDMDKVLMLAEKHNLKIIEDCAQGHFATYNRQYVGTFGDAGTYSFYPGKNLGAYGDAGFILCKSPNIEERLKRLIDHGRLDKFDHEIIGYNHRLDAIQAAILSIKLKHIHEWTKKRQAIAEIYNETFRKIGIKVIESPSNKRSVYHVYCIEVEDRPQIQELLKKHGIQTGIHYPTPVHLMPAFDQLPKARLDVTEHISSKILSLPIYPEMDLKEVEFVTERIKNYVA